VTAAGRGRDPAWPAARPVVAEW